VPLIVCTDPARSPESVLKEVNEKMNELPDEIESIRIIKPQGGIHSHAVLQLSQDPLLATREFYGRLREVANQGPDCIVFYREPVHSGERWESLFDRLNKAASLIL
ncbi:MAG TPA: Sua5 family C-terminal domain-containing protein, partial [Bdellovibrio sp.]